MKIFIGSLMFYPFSSLLRILSYLVIVHYQKEVIKVIVNAGDLLGMYFILNSATGFHGDLRTVGVGLGMLVLIIIIIIITILSNIG